MASEVDGSEFDDAELVESVEEVLDIAGVALGLHGVLIFRTELGVRPGPVVSPGSFVGAGF